MLNRNYRLAFALLALLVSGAISFPSPAGARTVQKEAHEGRILCEIRR